MLKNKINDNKSYKERMLNYFNPYEYRCDIVKDEFKNDLDSAKSKSHVNRKKMNK